MSYININPPVIGHRGASRFAPENTLAAIIQAKQLGAEWVEFDVMLSACGEPVVIHDETLNRTTNAWGGVNEYPYSYLQTLDAGSWFSPKFANERIPRLRDVMVCLAEHDLGANVELKSWPGKEVEVVERVMAEIKDHWPASLPRPLISSFSLPTLKLVREHSSDALLGLLIHEWFEGWEQLSADLNCVSVNLNNAIVTAEVVSKIKNMDKSVLVYTVNQAKRAEALFSWGVDAVFTDDIPAILAIV